MFIKYIYLKIKNFIFNNLLLLKPKKMQKSFFPDDIMEFKLNNKWFKGNIKDILISENKFVLNLSNLNQNYEHKNSILIFNNYSFDTIKKNLEKNFEINQRIEFYDEINNSWQEANIETKNNDFYIISYANKNSMNNTKILYKNNIRALTNNNDMIKLNLEKVKIFSLKKFEKFENCLKYCKKLVKKLVNILKDKILYTFMNENLDLFIFWINNENDNLNENEIINGLIDIGFKHFEEIDKKNKKLFK